MIPLQRPAPELPTSRPRPLALEAPTDIVTATLPPRPMPPVTLPPPADETRRPDTLKGTLLVELQLPAVVAKATFQTPSSPALTTLARRAGVGGAGRDHRGDNRRGEHPAQGARGAEIGKKGDRSG